MEGDQGDPDMTEETAIGTWIVLDEPDEATEFPSVGADSASPDFQLTYWRCIALFFLTSRAHNPRNPHLLYCNKPMDSVVPGNIAALLGDLDVRFVQLPLTHRLPRGTTSRWGNVFYEIDVLSHFADHGDQPALLLADSDCIWRRTFAPYEERLRESGCLLYALQPTDQADYQGDVLINGMSRHRMTAVSHELFGVRLPHREIAICGGEFTAFTRDWCRSVLPMVNDLWHHAQACATKADTVRTEEHMWSIIALASGVRPCGANDIVRRIWTNFEAFNARTSDLTLAVWHLPAEKKYGFRRMWNAVEASRPGPAHLSAEALNAMTERFMGVPRRGARKTALDLEDKARERFRALCRPLAASFGPRRRAA